MKLPVRDTVASAFDDLETVDLGANTAGTVALPSTAARKKKATTKSATQPKWRFIDVPYAEKDKAKALGARWNADARLWYIPKGLGRKKFRWPDVKTSTELLRKLALIEEGRKKELMREQQKRYRAAARPKDPSVYMATNRVLSEAHSRLRFLLSSDD